MVCSSIAFCLFTMKQNLKYASLIDNLNESHAKEIADLKQIQDESDKRQTQNIYKLNTALAQIDEKYNTQITELNKKKTTEYRQILETTNDDPAELAKRLSSATGIKVVTNPSGAKK
jgi:tRNA A37 N6-isopentenylltransferase MiaA